MDAAFGSLKRRKSKEEPVNNADPPVILINGEEVMLEAKEKRRRFSNQFLRNSVDWFGSLRREPKEGDKNFLVANYNTREASQHSLLKQLKHQNSKPRMRSKIGCFYFADLQYLSRSESTQTLEEEQPVSTVPVISFCHYTVTLGFCGNGRLFGLF